MKQNIPVMSVTGSDNTGFAGVQADIRTISALGARAVTAITSITVQDAYGIQSIHDLPASMVAGQTKAVFNDVHPRAVKVGMVRDAETVRALRNEIIGCRKIILVPGILPSHGERLLSDAAIEAWKSNLIPEASLLILKCSEAELLLGMTVATNDDMVRAAERLVEMGAQAVMLRGGHQTEAEAFLLVAQHRRLAEAWRCRSILYGGGNAHGYGRRCLSGGGKCPCLCSQSGGLFGNGRKSSGASCRHLQSFYVDNCRELQVGSRCSFLCRKALDNNALPLSSYG